MAVVKCDQKGCEYPATHYLVWTKPQRYCVIHAQSVLNIAAAMGFPTPTSTLRQLTIEEMVTDDTAAPATTDAANAHSDHDNGNEE